MIRFSHSANSWQFAIDSDGWNDIDVIQARALFDAGVSLWHEQRLIVI